MGRDKEKKERIRDHHSWLQLDPAGVSRVLEHTWSKRTGLSGSSLVEISFPHPGNKFCFPCKIVTMCSLFFQIFLEMGWEALGSLVVSIPLLQSLPTSQPHSCTFAVLCCAYLQESDQGLLSQKSAVLSLATSCSFSQCGITYTPCVLKPTTLGWAHSHSVISV